MSEKRLTGRIARENIKLMQVPRPPQGVIEGFRALSDATGIVYDVMDELGIPCGVVGAHILRPPIPGSRIVGPALTVRNVVQRLVSPCWARCRPQSVRQAVRESN